MRNLIRKWRGLLLTATVVFTACEGPPGPEGPPGAANIKYINYTVNKPDWRLLGNPDDIGSYFIYEFNEPFLTPNIYESGAIVGYMFYNESDGREYQTALPYTVYDIAIDGIGEEKPYSIQYMCDFAPGKVFFKVTYSDFYTKEFSPNTLTFRVMYIW